ncbi:hypothetical protein SCOR_00920 [Sulfidibacter corallicola]|uniref:Uncharacterized protein n=1 Tax=Sulfidibacter corallicola TaxID=2818388 RepID=A0A8A4TIC6_SULCO|nr:hypothetical protein [Sulfidibacter corallicola]QTD48912.1 hypothetical protein J3U87_25290 [Sulfidibacter corallicola]
MTLLEMSGCVAAILGISAGILIGVIKGFNLIWIFAFAAIGLVLGWITGSLIARIVDDFLAKKNKSNKTD